MSHYKPYDTSSLGYTLTYSNYFCTLKVIGLARRIEKMLQDASAKYIDKKGSFHPIRCDLAVEEDLLNAFKTVKETYGPLSILVNCAGVIGNTNLVDGMFKINVCLKLQKKEMSGKV